MFYTTDLLVQDEEGTAGGGGTLGGEGAECDVNGEVSEVW